MFSTIESLDLATTLRVELGPNKLIPFERTTLLTSIYDCCKHMSKPAKIADELTTTIITTLLHKKTAILSRAIIVNASAEVLSRFDKAAGVQYLAFHPLKQDN